ADKAPAFETGEDRERSAAAGWHSHTASSRGHRPRMQNEAAGPVGPALREIPLAGFSPDEGDRQRSHTTKKARGENQSRQPCDLSANVSWSLADRLHW